MLTASLIKHRQLVYCDVLVGVNLSPFPLPQVGGWVSPDGPRPASSGSTKEEDFRLMNGTVPHAHHPATNGNFHY